MKTIKQLIIPISFMLLMVLLFNSCADKIPVEECLEGREYNFWYGLWHGFIAPLALIGMLFDDSIVVFAENNSGFWYALGFLIGSGGWGIMGGKQLGGKNKKNE